ncbi:metalloregulator ArsR/SmtB family transcription factor [Planctobacterium marinum]|uniref:metalloregulator ArsR/SmtB family transcription factor n=1 Tax=Planctobacterium marinum TaxID=1631968 RepID=UPI001E5F6B2C|nr:metalloregulator ArsR/SmtB family transcription factor [Planctobacterium marinum]MCC2604737.1 metalloregulator ArsR/SmtB family transcription factor [Planctobacterium marinum]
MNPLKFFKCLADETRLKSLLLIQQVGEACVCDLMHALDLEQPKISRHLADLRRCEIVQDERRGKWVYYRLHPNLASWAKDVLALAASDNPDFYATSLQRLQSQINCCPQD